MSRLNSAIILFVVLAALAIAWLALRTESDAPVDATIDQSAQRVEAVSSRSQRL